MTLEMFRLTLGSAIRNGVISVVIGAGLLSFPDLVFADSLQPFTRPLAIQATFDLADKNRWSEVFPLNESDPDLRLYLRWLCAASLSCPDQWTDARDLYPSRDYWPKAASVRRRIETNAVIDLLSSGMDLPISSTVRRGIRARLSMAEPTNSNRATTDDDHHLLQELRVVSPQSVDTDHWRQWFERYPAMTGDGVVATIALMDSPPSKLSDEAIETLRAIWRVAPFTGRQQKWGFRRLRDFLRPEDDESRVSWLLDRENHDLVPPLLDDLSPEFRLSAEVRLSLQKQRSGIAAIVSQLPQQMRLQPDIALDIARYFWKHKKWEQSVSAILLGTSGSKLSDLRLSLQQAYTKIVRRIVRELILENRWIEAEDLLSLLTHHHPSRVIRGWLLLRKLNNPKGAIDVLRGNGDWNLPANIDSQRLYWLAQAILAQSSNSLQFAKQKTLARLLLKQAAQRSTSFYGQLATQQISQNTPIPSLPSVEIDPVDQDRFVRDPLVRTILKLSESGIEGHVRRGLVSLSDHINNPSQWRLLAQLAIASRQTSTLVRVVTWARNNDVTLIDQGYPWMKRVEGFNHRVDSTLVMALIRQESGFNHRAVSSSGARGLMQIMPATARFIAHRTGTDYTASRLLNDPDYNIHLGISYLEYLLKRYDRALHLALAAYNGGPGNVDRWLAKIRPSGSDILSILDWIESIPLHQTRDYVKKVIETHTIYRQMIFRRWLPVQFFLSQSPQPTSTALDHSSVAHSD